MAIPNLIYFIVIGQVVVWIFQTLLGVNLDKIMFIPGYVAQGEIWRLFTFPFYPPQTWHWLFLIFAWYILLMMGTALEQEWGSTKFSLYVFTGLFFAILAGVVGLFLSPGTPITNLFISTSIFLAFAFVNPNYEFMLFFILPVKVKWLAMLTGVFLLWAFIGSGMMGKVVILAGLGNYFIFFGRDMVTMVSDSKARAQNRTRFEQAKMSDEEPFHVCSVCGATDVSHPEREFFYTDGVGICNVCLEKQQKEQEP